MVMKLTAILLLSIRLPVSATGFSPGVTLSSRNVSVNLPVTDTTRPGAGESKV